MSAAMLRKRIRKAFRNTSCPAIWINYLAGSTSQDQFFLPTFFLLPFFNTCLTPLHYNHLADSGKVNYCLGFPLTTWCTVARKD
uniref:Uncharacterized protein n=1 Tax=Anguilla anguilla TaxID=7936 RepID=A0A0E9WXN0_ANGAN